MRSNRNSIVRWSVAVITVSAAGVMAGCSDSGTSPSEAGSVQAYVQDRPSSGGEASHLVARDGQSGFTGQTAGTFSGSFDAEAQVAISTDGHAWIELGPPSSASVQLQATGNGADVHGEVAVPVGTYTRVRLTLTGAEARLNAGSTIGGISLGATVDIRIGANGTVVIEKEVPPFEIRADARTRVFWDLNSHLWVNRENVEEEEVEEEEVEEAAEPRTETEPSDPMT